MFWIAAPGYAVTCIVVSAATFFLAHLVQSRFRVILWFDAVGLALFAVLGAGKALSLDAAPIIAVVMGVMSATFGGIIRNALGGEVALLSRREIYFTAAFMGALVYKVLVELGIDVVLAGGSGFVAGFLIRAIALYRGLCICLRIKGGPGVRRMSCERWGSCRKTKRNRLLFYSFSKTQHKLAKFYFIDGMRRFFR